MADPFTSQDPVQEKLQELGYPPPEAFVSGSLPPGGGHRPLPHYQTFSQIVNNISRTYRYTFDEARRHNDENAVAIRRDPMIMEALRTRQMPTAQLAWHLEPLNDQDTRQQDAVSVLTDVINRTPRWQQFKMHLLEALWFGRYGVIPTFRWDYTTGHKQLIVADHVPLNGDKMVFKWSGEVGVLVHATYQGNYVITDRGRAHFLTPEEREQLVLHEFEPEDADFFEGDLAGGIHGVGIRGRVYWMWWLRTQVLTWMMDYLERVGAGGFTIYYYEAGNDQSLTEVTNAAQTQITNNVILFPRYKDGTTGGPGIERIEPSNSGVNLLISLITQYFDLTIRRYILGESISSESEGINVGNGMAELDAATFGRRIKYDAISLQETLTRDFLTVLAKYNTPGVPTPRFVFDVDKPNAQEVLEAAQIFYGMGGSLDEDELRSILGLAAPEEGHNVLSQLGSVQPAGIGAMPTGVPMAGTPGPEGPGSEQPVSPDGQPQPEETSAQDQVPILFSRNDSPVRYERRLDESLEAYEARQAEEEFKAGRITFWDYLRQQLPEFQTKHNGKTYLNGVDFGPAELQHVPVSKITGRPQSYRNPSITANYRGEINRHGQVKDPVSLRPLRNGQYHIWDGHHRVDATEAEGKTHIPAWVPVHDPTQPIQMERKGSVWKYEAGDLGDNLKKGGTVTVTHPDTGLEFTFHPKDGKTNKKGKTSKTLETPEQPKGPPVHFAPAGGVYLHGQFYQGGEHLPEELLSTLSPEHRTELEKGTIKDPAKAGQVFVEYPTFGKKILKNSPRPRYGQEPEEPEVGNVRKVPRDIRPHLTPEEISEVEKSPAQVRQLVKTFRRLDPKDFAVAAKAGEAKRGWYEDSAKLISDIFKHDSSRFVSLLAATSPRVPVDRNLEKALTVFKLWKSAGSPSDPNQIQKIVDKARRKGQIDTFQGHDNNIRLSLSSDSPHDTTKRIISGLKVDSFRRNLLGDLSAVTNDVWQSAFAGLPQSLVSKIGGYAGFNAVTRKAASILNKEATDNPWKPAEVQEAVWSFFRTVTKIQGQSRGRGKKEGLSAQQSLEKLTHEDILGTVDFSTLLKENPRVQKLLRSLGLEVPETQTERERPSGKVLEGSREGDRGRLRGIAERTKPHIGAFIGGRLKGFRRSSGQVVHRYEQSGVPAEGSSSPPSPLPGSPEPFTSSTPPPDTSSFSMFSPNTEENLSFEQANERVRSGNQASFRKMTDHVLRSVGVKDFKTFDAIEDWNDGAENSVVQMIPGGADPKTIDYAASWYGLLGNQKSVLTFHSDPQGPDSVYQLPVQETDTNKVRNDLTSLGIQYRTIVPTNKGHLVLVVDTGRQLRPAIFKFAEMYNAPIREALGKADFIGGSTRTEARAKFRDRIREFESSGQSHNRYRPPHSDSPGEAPQKLSRKGKIPAKVRYESDLQGPWFEIHRNDQGGSLVWGPRKNIFYHRNSPQEKFVQTSEPSPGTPLNRLDHAHQHLLHHLNFSGDTSPGETADYIGERGWKGSEFLRNNLHWNQSQKQSYAAKAPPRGAIVRGLYYPGGKFLPKEGEDLSPYSRSQPGVRIPPSGQGVDHLGPDDRYRVGTPRTVSPSPKRRKK